MTSDREQEISGLSRRGLLRNGLLAGFGITVAAGASATLAGTAKAELAQGSWRWCGRCSALFYGPHQSSSICPGADHHSFGSNWLYIVPYDEPAGTLNPQPRWYWCGQCKGLFHTDNIAYTFGGVCPKPGHPAHQAGQGSFQYSVYYATPSLGQPNWAYCRVCYGLFWLQPPYLAYGECPAGGLHDGSNTYNYDLAYTN
jgi:hypothetical protein